MSHIPMDDPASRLDRLGRDLAAELRRTRLSTILTGIVGTASLIALSVYFAFGYQMFDESTRPQRIVDVGQTLVEDQLPEARKGLEEEVIRSSPKWAEGLSQQTLAALPTAREQLEGHILAQVDEALAQGTVLTEDRFRTFLRQRGELIRRDLQELGDKPDLAESSLSALEAALQEQLQADMQSQARDLFAGLEGAVAKLKRYKTAADLSPEEQKERQVVLLARRIFQEDAGGPSALPESGSMKAPRRRMPGADDRRKAADSPSAEGDAKPEPAAPAEPAKPEGNSTVPAPTSDAPRP